MKQSKRTRNLVPYTKKPAESGLVRMHMNENQANSGRTITLDEESISLYPDEGPLQSLIANTWGIPEANLMLFNGASEAIMCAALALVSEDDAVVTVKPEFSLIPHYLALTGAKLIEMPMRNGTFQKEEMERKAKQSRMLFISVPHNPTGATITNEEILRWCKNCPETLFVIDEAYAGFTGSTLPNRAAGTKTKNLIVIRSFSKDMALAGLRLGAAAGPEEAIQAMAKVRTPYSINAAAIKAGAEAIRSKNRTEKVKQDMNTLAAATEVVGLKTRRRGGNFFLITGREAKSFARFCEERGILIRTLPDGTARVSPADKAGNERYGRCLKEWRKQK